MRVEAGGRGGKPADEGVPINFAMSGLTLAVSESYRWGLPQSCARRHLHIRTGQRHVVSGTVDEV